MTSTSTSEKTVQFAGANNESVNGYLSVHAESASFPGVIVIQEVWGVTEFIKETTRHFAAQGYAAIAPDLYSRLTNPDVSTLETARKAIGTLSDAQVMQDLQGAAQHLRDLPGFNGRIGVIGFCAGGRYTIIFGVQGKGVDAAITCYGPMTPNDIAGPDMRPVAPIDMASEIQCPLLGLYGENDKLPLPDDVAAFDEILTSAKKHHEFHMYPGVGHAFMNREGSGYSEEQASAAWKESDAWFEKYLK